jgi:hypothetical protein
MTPQSNFMVLAAVEPGREAEIRGLLESMNLSAGRVDPDNSLIPFAKFDRLHFARVLLLDDQTTGDVAAHGLPVTIHPLYLALLGDVDGDPDDFLDELADRATYGLWRIFDCCSGFTHDLPLAEWMRLHRSPPIANYINCRGRTVRQTREEANLREILLAHISTHREEYAGLSPREIHAKLGRFFDDEKSSGRITLTPDAPTPPGWRARNLFHLLAWPALILLLSPLLLVAAPFYLIALRRREKSDPELCGAVDQAYSDKLSLGEDHDVTNPFSAMGTLKPGLLRLLTVIGVLSTVDYAARHIVRPGRLGRIRTIHFARWVFLDHKRRMVFFSNYDGSVESYMDDFINKTGFGLNASFSNGIGYPRTHWLVMDGCADERKYKEFLRRHTIPTQVWYKAYPGLTAIDLERNTRIRRGLEMPAPGEREAREWVALL